jgi:hypothetical protein
MKANDPSSFDAAGLKRMQADNAMRLMVAAIFMMKGIIMEFAYYAMHDNHVIIYM